MFPEFCPRRVCLPLYVFALCLLAQCLLVASSSLAAPPKAPKVVAKPVKSPEKRPEKSPEKRPEKRPEKGSNLENALGAGQSDEPLLIRSDSFQLDSKNRNFYYRDNVEILKGDMTITADVMIGKYDEKNQLREVTCENNVVITRGDRLRATSNRAVYDVPRDKVVLTEGPELNDRGNVLSADRVTIFVKEDRSEADGHVRVKVIKSEGQADILSAVKRGRPTSAEEKKQGE